MGLPGALVVGAFVGFMQVGVWILVPASILWGLAFHTGYVGPLLVMYAFSYFDGADAQPRQDRTWPALSRRFWLFGFMRAYFPLRVHLPSAGLAPALAQAPPTAQDREGKKRKPQYMFAFHPHGTMADYRVMIDGLLLDLLPGLEGRIRWLAASILFRLPLVREIVLWTGCINARRQVAEKALQQGFSVGLIPGGEQEQLRTEFGKESVYLERRLGFVKLALKFGVPLVPCYVFGCVDSYRTSRRFYSVRRKLVSALGVCLPFCWGEAGLPLVPLQQPLNVVIGAPLDLGSCDFSEPSQEQVADAHQKYVAALRELFDANKAKYGYADRTLEVL